MDGVSKEVLALLTQLLPGFVTAWVVYGLTSYPKPAQLERIIQALIYSFIIGMMVEIERRLFKLCAWNGGKSFDSVAAATSAICLGLAIAFFSNNDKFYALARWFRLTTRTAYPTEWYGAFATRNRYVVLHLKGARRICGYPTEWPSEPSTGHFRLTNAAWIGAENHETPLDRDESILIQAKTVEMVEFLKDIEETKDAPNTAEPTAKPPTGAAGT